MSIIQENKFRKQTNTCKTIIDGDGHRYEFIANEYERRWSFQSQTTLKLSMLKRQKVAEINLE